MSPDTSNLQDSQERWDLRPNLETDFLHGVTVACCKVAIDGHSLSYRICCGGSGRVSWPACPLRPTVSQSPTVGASPGYPWPENWGRNWSRKVRETRSSSSPKRSERGQEVLQRVERGIHRLNRWAVNCLEMSRKRGVQAARNGPSLPPCVAKAEMSTADRLGSRERTARATHFVAPMSACTRSAFTRTEQACGREK